MEEITTCLVGESIERDLAALTLFALDAEANGMTGTVVEADRDYTEIVGFRNKCPFYTVDGCRRPLDNTCPYDELGGITLVSFIQREG